MSKITGRLLGIDHGIKRVGLAVSDISGITARELMILQRASKREDFTKINAIATEQDVIGIIVGIPYHDAPPGVYTQADTVRLWMSRLAETTELPVIEWDEQLTSEDSREIARLQKRAYDAHIDDIAARLILQSYLNALSDDLATFPVNL